MTPTTVQPRFSVPSRRIRAAVLALWALVWLMPGLGGAPAHAQAPAAGPSFVYSTYLGGQSGDEGKSVAVDPAGNLYVIGKTYSEAFLGQETPIKGYSDIFVAKFNPTGTALIYLKIVGGDDSDSPLSVRVDAQGNAYVTGIVFDDTFPTQQALWPTRLPSTNSVLFKLDADGDLVYSTYLPLDVFDTRQNLAVDSAGNAYVTGSYPMVEEDGAYLGSQVALLKLNPMGTQVLLDRHIGGEGPERGTAIGLDANGMIYLAGVIDSSDGFPVTANAHQAQCGDQIYRPDAYCFQDGLVVVLDAAGEVTYASYHGGSFTDKPDAIAADGQGNVLLAGQTASGQFPLVQPVVSSCPPDTSSGHCYSPYGFVSLIRIQPGKSTLTYSTYLGSTERASHAVITAATLDGAGNAYVTGYTNGKHFPLKDPVQSELYESFCHTFSSERYCFDGFLVKLTPAGALAFGTYLGAVFDDYPHDVTTYAGQIYVTGTTEADDFPVTADAIQPTNLLGDDAFLVKLGTAGTAPLPTPRNRLQLPALMR